MIKTVRLTKKFRDNIAVDDFSIDITKGEIVGIVGPNGAGKTTLLSMLSTLLLPTSGAATIKDFDIVKQAADVRKIIGVVFQESVVDEELDAYTNLDIHGLLYKLDDKERQERAKKLLELVELDDARGKTVSKFSGGMKRRLEIARGLMSEPEVFFLDEPTLGLDPGARSRVWKYIKEINKTKSTTIVVTTNYMQEAEILCDRVAIMSNGKLIVFDTVKRLKDSLKGDIIDITSSKTDMLVGILKKHSDLKNIEKHGGSIRIYVSNGEEKLAALLNLLKKHDILLKSITLKKPTLDDVFLHYCGEQLE